MKTEKPKEYTNITLWTLKNEKGYMWLDSSRRPCIYSSRRIARIAKRELNQRFYGLTFKVSKLNTDDLL
jgi:hypothetical protein